MKVGRHGAVLVLLHHKLKHTLGMLIRDGSVGTDDELGLPLWLEPGEETS